MVYGTFKAVHRISCAMVLALAFGTLAQAQDGIPASIQLEEELPAFARVATPVHQETTPQPQVVPVQYQAPVRLVAQSVISSSVPTQPEISAAAPVQSAIPATVPVQNQVFNPAPVQGTPIYTPDGKTAETVQGVESAPIVEEEPMAEAPANSLFLESFAAPYTQVYSSGLLGAGNFFVEGYVDQGFNVNSNKNNENNPMGVNDREGYELNQVYASIGRRVLKADQWSIGGQVDLMFGTDYYYMTSTGFETTTNNAAHWNGMDADRPEYRGGHKMYGMALPQAFGEIYAPILAGVDVKIGHFNSVMGFESNQATQNFFYSRSFQSIYGMPTSMTGVMTDWKITGGWSLVAGAVNEWNSFCTPENHFSLVVGTTYENYCGNFAFSALVMNGKQSAATFQAKDYTADGVNSTVVNLIAKYKFNERMAYVAEFTYGNHDAEVFDEWTQETFKGRNWYGFSNYLFYCMTEKLTLGMRFEWFHDKENTVISSGNYSTFANVPANYFSWTFGANYDPFHWLTIRPELRWDYCDLELEDVEGSKMYAFDRGTSNYQFTIGCDAIIRF